MTMLHEHHVLPLYLCTNPICDKRKKKHVCGLAHHTNIVQLTVEEHAEAHMKLYEQYGRDEDRIAWHGLAGIIGHEEAVHQMLSMAGKRGGRKGENHQFFGKKRPEHSAMMKGRKNPHSEEHKRNLRLVRSTSEYLTQLAHSVARDWVVTTPAGETITVHNMAQFCRENKLNKSTMSDKGYSKGYHAVKING